MDMLITINGDGFKPGSCLLIPVSWFLALGSWFLAPVY